MSGKQPTVFDMVNGLLAELSKQAEDEENRVAGPTEHPSQAVDNETQDATTGSRDTENEADVKQEGPNRVDAQPDGGEKEQGVKGLGMRQSAIGEDPEVEKDYGSKPEDPGTMEGPSEHPSARVAEKYGSLSEVIQNLVQRVNEFNKKLAESAESESTEQKSEPQAGKEEKSEETTKPAEEKKDKKEVAEVVIKVVGDTIQKEGADKVVEETKKAAEDAADMAAQFFAGFAEGIKEAADDLEAAEAAVDEAAGEEDEGGEEADLSADVTPEDIEEAVADIADELGIEPEEVADQLEVEAQVKLASEHPELLELVKQAEEEDELADELLDLAEAAGISPEELEEAEEDEDLEGEDMEVEAAFQKLAEHNPELFFSLLKEAEEEAAAEELIDLAEAAGLSPEEIMEAVEEGEEEEEPEESEEAPVEPELEEAVNQIAPKVAQAIVKAYQDKKQAEDQKQIEQLAQALRSALKEVPPTRK